MAKYRNNNIKLNTLKKGDIVWSAILVHSSHDENYKFKLVKILITSEIEQKRIGSVNDFTTPIVHYKLLNHIDEGRGGHAFGASFKNFIYLRDTLITSISGVPLYFTPNAAKRAMIHRYGADKCIFD